MIEDAIRKSNPAENSPKSSAERAQALVGKEVAVKRSKSSGGGIDTKGWELDSIDGNTVLLKNPGQKLEKSVNVAEFMSWQNSSATQKGPEVGASNSESLMNWQPVAGEEIIVQLPQDKRLTTTALRSMTGRLPQGHRIAEGEAFSLTGTGGPDGKTITDIGPFLIDKIQRTPSGMVIQLGRDQGQIVLRPKSFIDKMIKG